MPNKKPAKKEAKAELLKTKKGSAKVAEPEVTEPKSEDEEDDAPTSSSGSGGGLAAAALAAQATEMNAGSLKNFRHHPDMENFYRFIFENDLRVEAVQIIDEMKIQRQLQTEAKSSKSKAH